MAKAFSAVMNMDSLVGKDFEEGLANLNKIAKASP
jgi:L-cysteine desulfidase